MALQTFPNSERKKKKCVGYNISDSKMILMHQYIIYVVYAEMSAFSRNNNKFWLWNVVDFLGKTAL